MYKQKIVGVFRAFIKICEEHDLQYFCHGGTAIGVVRHQGLIPWDDDIDVLMPRPDYEKFLSLFPQLEQKEYELIIPGRPPSYYLPFAKMCDKNTTLLEFKHVPCVLGAFVDIFPLDGASNEREKRAADWLLFRRIANKLMILPKSAKANFAWLFKRLSKFQLRTAINEISCAFGKKRKYKKVNEQLHYIMTRHEYSKAEYVGSYGSQFGIKAFWPKSWFDGVVMMSFEGIEVRLPVGYDQLLTQVYGDYMQLPPKNQRGSHHNVAYLNLEERKSVEEVYQELNKKKRLNSLL
ncbi:LicD family protein [Sphingobacterium sp. DN00404]|uniref:LicD family protein n=1 Tax=Sphingobacterium micropteri TaxID=2763501 RepID=A0ABR7YLN3_9SPHI|nr:LicD family protein [Sphingobacterium micropteri]MBD1432235.1 LicD family protein [Sphingobacterium micropteri]